MADSASFQQTAGRLAGPDAETRRRYSRNGCVPTRELRYLLSTILRWRGAPMTVAELVDAVDEFGVGIDGRPTKTVSDALRAEVNRGRVVRVGWGRYRSGTMPRSTWRYVRGRARRAIAEFARAA